VNISQGNYKLLYHPAVAKKDLPAINHNLYQRIKKAIKERLSTSPEKYGEPLRKSLKGYWKLRVGDYRIIYKVVGSEVWILLIGHRSEVYRKAERRFE